MNYILLLPFLLASTLAIPAPSEVVTNDYCRCGDGEETQELCDLVAQGEDNFNNVGYTNGGYRNAFSLFYNAATVRITNEFGDLPVCMMESRVHDAYGVSLENLMKNHRECEDLQCWRD